ncbi:hypothetical protein A2Z22_04365 [Candidatus Woesebacteria bacterium RBG_16_34_12]|uniref:Uncharacterized protein n=1 Tax=Candidatus Woesebacteria bacterium RBG_16_34_12 TaxID=1802480 RepID=A0A1F7XBS0_9BACT|nr:MAG: hypothetical protein A2Z22_04365 [Candidatus Woesebacteria bacterium RBG_16_34_12]
MVITPERKELEDIIKTRPEDVSIPEHIEKKEGIVPRQAQFTAQVTDDQGQPLIQTPQAKTITIQLPADQVQLAALAKGSPSKALTWFAQFWLRLIKKAIHFGWKIVKGSNPPQI